MPARHSEALFIAALGFCQVCAWGSLYYSYPLIVEAMMPELGWTREQAYGPATLGLLVAAFAAAVGVAIDRGYGRWLLAGSSILAAVLFMLWSRVNTLAAFYLVATLLGALQASTLYEPAFAVLARRVGVGKARQGITQITLWGGFASTVFIPLVQFFLDHWTWREALWCLAAVNGLLAALYLAQIHPDRDLAHHQETAGDQVRQDRLAFRQTMRNKVFWLLILAMAAYASAFSAFTFHMYPMLIEGGLPVSDVILALALIGPSQVAGRILISWLGRHSSIRRIGCWTVALLPPVFPALLIFGDHLADRGAHVLPLRCGKRHLHHCAQLGHCGNDHATCPWRLEWRHQFACNLGQGLRTLGSCRPLEPHPILRPSTLGHHGDCHCPGDRFLVCSMGVHTASRHGSRASELTATPDWPR